MTKTELIDAIASGVDGLTKARAERTLDVALQAIMESVGKGDTANSIGFDTLSQGECAERVTHNPRTGEGIKVGATRTVRFKAGQKLKDAANA